LAGLQTLLALDFDHIPAVGTYGVVSAAVTARSREMGIRLALGAPPSEVLRLVLRGGFGLVLGGMVLGIAGAIVLSNSVASLLFGVTPADPIAFASAAAVILATGVLAILVPARRAARVDPASALRAE
jgi:ABC-type antimicrobial peptide transport system permease subunit